MIIVVVSILEITSGICARAKTLEGGSSECEETGILDRNIDSCNWNWNI